MDDKRFYLMTYDAFGRLVKVRDRRTSGMPVVADYRYNGLGHRIGWHYDTAGSSSSEPDGTLDSSDPWFHFVYDDRWRMVATYRSSKWSGETGYSLDPLPKEQFVYHAAGEDGRGNSSYIDACVVRQRNPSAAGRALCE